MKKYIRTYTGIPRTALLAKTNAINFQPGTEEREQLQRYFSSQFNILPETLLEDWSQFPEVYRFLYGDAPM